MIAFPPCKVFGLKDKQKVDVRKKKQQHTDKQSIITADKLFTPREETGCPFCSNEEKSPCVVSKIMIKADSSREGNLGQTI